MLAVAKLHVCAMKLIVGLGNPGPEYQSTRHNAGFRVVEDLGITFGAHFSSKKDLFCDLAKIQIHNQDVLLVKPTTYMNSSGRAAQALLSWFKITRQNMLVIHDDVSLPLGRIRLQKGGGAGGQHGIESIIESFGGDKNFDRLKFGIGPDPGGSERANFVLSRFPENDKDLLNKALKLAVEASELWLVEGIGKAMNRFNGIRLDEPAEPKNEDAEKAV